jgi:hypothetical protein
MEILPEEYVKGAECYENLRFRTCTPPLWNLRFMADGLHTAGLLTDSEFLRISELLPSKTYAGNE